MDKSSAERSSHARSHLVFTIALLMLISTLRLANGQLLVALYEPMSKALGLNDLQFGTIRSAMDITVIVGALLFGILADRWRRRDLIAIGVLGWSVATWPTGQVGSFIFSKP
jgi:predicted MFS family arabinose efflux permease